jgi:hypothetical protein
LKRFFTIPCSLSVVSRNSPAVILDGGNAPGGPWSTLGPLMKRTAAMRTLNEVFGGIALNQWRGLWNSSIRCCAVGWITSPWAIRALSNKRGRLFRRTQWGPRAALQRVIRVAMRLTGLRRSSPSGGLVTLLHLTRWNCPPVARLEVDSESTFQSIDQVMNIKEAASPI